MLSTVALIKASCLVAILIRIKDEVLKRLINMEINKRSWGELYQRRTGGVLKRKTQDKKEMPPGFQALSTGVMSVTMRIVHFSTTTLSS